MPLCHSDRSSGDIFGRSTSFLGTSQEGHIFYHLKVIVTHFKVNNCYCSCWQCLWQSEGISSPIRKFENSRHVNHENHTDCGSRKYREQLNLMFRKEVNVISSFLGFSLQSLWSLDLKNWFGKKSVCCNADGNGTPRNRDSGGTGHWIWQVFKSATCTTEVDANFVLSKKLREQ